MISVKNIFIVAKKDLRIFFESPTGYIILIAFLLLWEFIFFRNVFVIGQSSLQTLFNMLPWLMLFLIPALTMGSISQEYQEGTIELLLTHPLKQLELILGKFLGVIFLFTVAILFSLPVALSLSIFGSLDWGVYFSQLLAAFFTGSVLISLGVFISSLLSSQISSMIVTAIASFLLFILGADLVTRGLPSFLGQLLSSLALITHYQSMSRGVIGLGDLWYFLSADAFLLSLAYLFVLRKRISKNKRPYRRLKAGIALLILALIVTNYFAGFVQARLDLTAEKVFTLSEGTRNVLGGLKQPVTINLYASKELPLQVQPVLDEVKSVLNDYKSLGGSNLIVQYLDPSSDTSLLQEALKNGVSQVQFNVVDKEELSLKNGFFGLAVVYAGQHRSIPFIQSTSDLEFQLTSDIHELTTSSKPVVAFLSGYDGRADYSNFEKALDSEFSVQPLQLDEKIPQIPADVKALVIADPKQKIGDSVRAALGNYLDQGGSLMVLVDQQEVDNTLKITPNKDNFADFTKDFGVTINPDLVYDLRSNETISFSTNSIQYELPYPFFARVPANPDAQVTAKIKSAVLPWASSLTVDDAKIKSLGYASSVLLKTTPFAGSELSPFSIAPNQPLAQTNLGEKIMAVSLQKPVASAPGKLSRIVIVGDGDLFADPFAFVTENQVFGVNALSWLTQEESLASIKLKALNDRKLIFKDETQMALVRYGNLALVLLLPLSFGLYNFLRRKSLRHGSYKRG